LDTSPFKDPKASIGLSDDRCYVGEAEFQDDPRGEGTELSGKLFTLRTLMV
jgi:hypothetical protein